MRCVHRRGCFLLALLEWILQLQLVGRCTGQQQQQGAALSERCGAAEGEVECDWRPKLVRVALMACGSSSLDTHTVAQVPVLSGRCNVAE